MNPTAPDLNIPASDEREKLLERAMARHHNSGDALIEILHTAQQLYGYLSRPLLSKMARRLNLPPSHVLGVATFYHLFRFEPPKKHSAIVCLGTACYASGAGQLLAAAQQSASEGEWTLTTGRCVGSCGLAPIAICDGIPLARVKPGDLAAVLGGKHDG
ncbi:MAG: NAD(P)H-dependent oxidoreductase subunit E [Acidobacteriia bacterium]|nr:NAD(P)H-dependent oxidoreductase subunit E [Terriglobia bacterium]